MCAAPCPRGIDIALFEQEALQQIVLAPDDRFLPFALFDGEDRRKGIVLDVDGSDGFAQLLLAGMGEQHDGFIAMVHAAVGQAGLIVEDEPDLIFAGNVERGDDRELAPVDASDRNGWSE